MSRGVCYVEMNSVVDAMFLHNQLLANPPAIEGKIVEVKVQRNQAFQFPSSSHICLSNPTLQKVGYHKQPGREIDRSATVISIVCVFNSLNLVIQTPPQAFLDLV